MMYQQLHKIWTNLGKISFASQKLPVSTPMSCGMIIIYKELFALRKLSCLMNFTKTYGFCLLNEKTFSIPKIFWNCSSTALIGIFSTMCNSILDLLKLLYIGIKSTQCKKQTICEEGHPICFKKPPV